MSLENGILLKMKLLQRYLESDREYVGMAEIIEDLPFLHSTEFRMIKQWFDLHKKDPQDQKSTLNDRAFFEPHRLYVLNILDAAFKLEVDYLLNACILYLDGELQYQLFGLT
nr:hypothetical protein HmN_000473100 [Hymenolepis microstoma]